MIVSIRRSFTIVACESRGVTLCFLHNSEDLTISPKSQNSFNSSKILGFSLSSILSILSILSSSQPLNRLRVFKGQGTRPPGPLKSCFWPFCLPYLPYLHAILTILTYHTYLPCLPYGIPAPPSKIPLNTTKYHKIQTNTTKHNKIKILKD